jgi:hypothetical protein
MTLRDKSTDSTRIGSASRPRQMKGPQSEGLGNIYEVDHIAWIPIPDHRLGGKCEGPDDRQHTN